MLFSFVFLQVMEVSYDLCDIRNNPLLCLSKSLSKPWLTPFRICGGHPFAAGWIPAENRRWGFITEWCQLESDPSLQTKQTDSLVSPFSLSSKSFFRKKRSWWMLKCTYLPWGWSRPFSSRGSSPSWSSEGKWKRTGNTCLCCYTGFLENLEMHQKGNWKNLLTVKKNLGKVN